MWCPSPHWRERWVYRLIWGETAKLFPEYHRHTIVHLHWIQIQVNSNSRLNDLQLPLMRPWLCKAAVPPSPVLGCPSRSLPLLVSLLIMRWKRLYWGSVRVWTHKPTHKPLVSEPHFEGGGMRNCCEFWNPSLVSIQWVLLRPNRIRWSDSTGICFYPLLLPQHPQNI